MPSYTDKELLQFIKNEDNKNFGFDLLVKTYQEKLYWHIRRIVINHADADDVLQNTLLKVWDKIDTFRSESGLFTWLYRIATNEALGFLRKKKTKFLLPLVDLEEKLGKELEADPWFDGNEIQKKLQKALLSLPEKQRIVFNMKYFDEMKYEEISRVLDTSVGALKASFHHAQKKIEKYFETD